ncbi:MAG: response regulator [Bryobacteraceae bacterium]|jgi:two-component system chemotaxis response regulator CheY
MRSLIVDDDFTNRLVLQSILSQHGKCQVAVNGRDAVNAFRKAADTGLCYDLVCMDISMPEMDGFTAVKQIRELEDARGILSNAGTRIIMTTASDDTKDIFRSVRESCNGYLVKPVSTSQLLDRLRLLGLIG